MHARIGTACTQGADRLGGKALKRVFESVLYCLARELTLPALVALPQIADTQCQPLWLLNRSTVAHISSVPLRSAELWL